MSALKSIVIGCGSMGNNQANILQSLDEYELVAVVDIFEEAAKKTGEKLGVPWSCNLEHVLNEYDIDVVAICSSNKGHAEACICAARHQVKAVYCEKPMAINLGEAKEMRATCEEHGVILIINHQRRIGEDMRAMKKAIDDGLIGEIIRIRTDNGGDILSDGTHGIDSMCYLANDAEVKSVTGLVHRKNYNDSDDEASGYEKGNGYRFGHAIEDGGVGFIEFANGIRGEVYCGDMVLKRTAYQCYEVTGTKGRLWRVGDYGRTGGCNVFIDDGNDDSYDIQKNIGDDKWMYRPRNNTWRPLIDDLAGKENGIEKSYKILADCLKTGATHPMSGNIGYTDMEIVMAIYESARLGHAVALPLQQNDFPLDLMIAEQQLQTNKVQ